MSNVKLIRSYFRLAGWYGHDRKADRSFLPELFLLLEMRSIFSAVFTVSPVVNSKAGSGVDEYH